MVPGGELSDMISEYLWQNRSKSQLACDNALTQIQRNYFLWG